MIRKASDISQEPKQKAEPVRYRITTTLLNQWQRYLDSAEGFEYYDEDVNNKSKEDAIAEERAKRYQELLDLLNRKPFVDNKFTIGGKEYEDKVCNGFDDVFSPYVKNGAFQVTVTKDVDIDGVPITLYGILDVLKRGRIMDIKRIFSYYKYPKYDKSHQHAMYLYLVPEAIDFTYLICDARIEAKTEEVRSKCHHLEHYDRQNCENIIEVCSNFINWLKANNLFEIYTQKWQMKNYKRR